MPSSTHNADDVAFASQMIPHHQQALAMADMVPSRTNNTALQVVAVHIRTDQHAEIDTLTGFLTGWGVPVDTGSHMAMDGMVDDATMAQLQTLRGPEFDTAWTKAMIRHHRGALDMARAELAHGQDPDALRAAQIIVTTQEREISYLTGLISATE